MGISRQKCVAPFLNVSENVVSVCLHLLESCSKDDSHHIFIGYHYFFFYLNGIRP